MDDKITEKNNKKHFVLVHGFCHGAWCWYKLVTLIKMNGHDATALDLGGCGVHPKQIHDISSLSDYVQPLMDFMAALPDDRKVIFVGHSFGGVLVSLALERFPAKVALAVFVTAIMPACGDPPGRLVQEFFKRSSIESFMDCKFTFDENLPVSAIFGPDYLAARVYTHCPPEDLVLSKTLVRPNKFFLDELGKESLLSETGYGKIKRCYVKCKNDEVVDEEFQSYVIDNNPPQELVTIEEAGHMVMLSKPQQLYSCLLELAHKH